MRSPSTSSTFLRTTAAAGVLFFLLVIFPQSVRGESIAISLPSPSFSYKAQAVLVFVDDFNIIPRGFTVVISIGEALLEDLKTSIEQLLSLFTGEKTKEEFTSSPILQKNTFSLSVISALTPPSWVASLARFQTILPSLLFIFPLLKFPVRVLFTVGLGLLGVGT